MFVKFKFHSGAFNDNNNLYGMRPMRDALVAIMTANAGDEVANPNTQWIAEWNVLANAEAGGWDVEYDRCDDFTAGSNITSYDWMILLSSKTKKEGNSSWGTRYKKGFGFRNYATTTLIDHYMGGYQPTSVFIDLGLSSKYDSYDRCMGEYTSATTTNYGVWGSHYWYNLDSYEWCVAATEEYVVMWISGADNDFCGISDVTAGTPMDYSDASAMFPAVMWYNTFPSNSSSRDYGNIYERMHVLTSREYGYHNSNGPNYRSFQDFLYSPDGSSSTQKYQAGMSLGSTYHAANGYYYDFHKFTWDENQNKKPVLWPMVWYSPVMGNPYRELIGVKDVGLMEGSLAGTADRQKAINGWQWKIIIDDNGDRWVLIPAKGHVLKAVRCM